MNNGFEVYGFDVSEDAVKIANEITKDRDHFATRNICSTGFDGNQFDAVISRDVLDHMTKEDAKMALHELLRITRPGGIVCFTLDFIDDEYMSEIHDTDHEGNLIYTEGKWKGMVFHPFNKEEIVDFIPSGLQYSIEQENESFLVTVQK